MATEISPNALMKLSLMNMCPYKCSSKFAECLIVILGTLWRLYLLRNRFSYALRLCGVDRIAYYKIAITAIA